MVVENLSGEGGREDWLVASMIWLETLLLRAGENPEDVEFGLGKRLLVTEDGASTEVRVVSRSREAVLRMGFDFVEDT
jgi:hypothetical protein